MLNALLYDYIIRRKIKKNNKFYHFLLLQSFSKNTILFRKLIITIINSRINFLFDKLYH